MLEPVLVHAKAFGRRISMLLTAMAGDLMQRIALDSQEEQRCSGAHFSILSPSWL